MDNNVGSVGQPTAYLDESGVALQAFPASLAERSTLIELYRDMLMTRTLDAKAVSLQRSGRLGTFASSLGQEATAIGVGHAMQDSDVLLPSFREHGLQLKRGVLAEEILRFWGGDERGSNFVNVVEDFPVSITVGGHAPHAVGVALGIKLRGESRAAVCMLGDGATSKGDFYEALNAAGVWQLPVVFVISNNQWAISTPRAEQSAALTLAQKAVAAGFTGLQVDGNDVIAVSQMVGEALSRARNAACPCLVECLTYRMADHTTADDASRYRDAAEVERWRRRDPLERLRKYLVTQQGWSDSEDGQLREQCQAAIEEAAAAYLGTVASPISDMFDYLYSDLPHELEAQRQIALGEPEHGVDDA